MKYAVIVAIAAFVAAFTPTASQAQVFGASVGGAVPTGDIGDILDPGFGIGGFVGTWVGGSFLIKGDISYHAFSSKTFEFTSGGQDFEVEAEGGVVPIRGGFYKYWGESRRFYTGTSLGAYIPTGDLEAVDTKFGLGPRIGYLFPAGGGAIDLILEYHTVFIGDENPLTEEDRVFFDDDKISYLFIGLGYQVGS